MISEVKIVVGCDGGGSKTHAVICCVHEDGSLQAQTRGEAGPCNVLADGIDVGINNVLAAIRRAAEDTDLEENSVADVMVLALAGAGRGDQRAQVQQRIEQTCRVRRLHVIADFAAVLEAAEMNTPAMALVAGTGSIACARDERGVTHRSGGWGPLLGDEGSGYWIGLQSVKAVVRRLHEQSPHGPLVDAVLEHFGAGDLPQLISEAYSPRTDRVRIANLAPSVFSLINQDDLPRQIITDAADHLARLLVDVARARLQLGERRVDWVCAGGLLTNQASFREQIRQRCAALGLALSEPHVVHHPVEGAVKMGLALLSKES